MVKIFSTLTNPELKSEFVKNVYKRILSDKIKQLAGKFPVISINGPRQSGKTTLIKLCFLDYDYVNLEMPDNRAFAQEDPRAFLNSYTDPIIIQIERAFRIGAIVVSIR